MTSRLHIDALTVRYPGRPAPALTDVSLDIRPGERLGITGRTGAGKSTLALVSSGLIPRVVRAAVSGRVVVDDVDALAGPTGSLLGRCGIVFASPADQLSGAKPTVRDELAFGLENLGVARTDMDPRIDVVLAELGIAHLADREPGSLSGGEMQRVAIASIVAMGPGLLILDEPTAELDPDGTMAVAALIDRLAGAGTSILCVGHEPRILERCDRVLTLEVGALVSGSVVRPAIPPLTWSIEAGRPGVGVSIEDVGFRYPDGVEALRDVSLEVRPGERVAVVGANGSGKTTLAKQLIGLLRPTSGRVLLDGVPTQGHSVQTLAETVGFAFQDPADQLFERSVEREVAFGPRQLGRTGIELDTLIEAALAMTGLTGERATNPYDLDRSVRKLVTLAGVLAMDPGLLVLDEPTTGQDPEGTERVGRVVEAMAAAGRTVIAITHDPVFADRWFDRTVVMAAGRALGHPPPGA